MKIYIPLYIALALNVFPVFAQSGEALDAGAGTPTLAENGLPDSEEFIEFGEDAGMTITADSAPAVPVTTPFGSHNVVSEQQIKDQGSMDFLDALRDVPGVMFSKRNMIGTNTAASLYIRGRGSTHPSLDTVTNFDGTPHTGLIYGQSMADSIPLYATSGMEVFKSPQPAHFGAGYAMVNVIPKYMKDEGTEYRAGVTGGSFAAIAENAAFGLKRGKYDVYAAQSWLSTKGHTEHSGAYQQSYYLNSGLQLSKNWSIRLLGNFVDAETDQPPQKSEIQSRILRTYKTDAIFSTASFNNNYEKAFGFIKLYFNNTNFDILDETGVAGEWSKQLMTESGARGSETFFPWNGGEITGGFDLDWARTSNTAYRTAKNTLTEFPDIWVFTPYAAISQCFGKEEKFHVVPSAAVRVYLHNLWANKTSPQAGISAGYNNTNINFNFSMGVTYPAAAALQYFINSNPNYNKDDFKKTNPEIVYHYEVGITHTQKKFFSAALSWFYDDGWDRLVMNPNGLPGNVSPIAYYKISGIEIAASVTPIADKLEFFGGASWFNVDAMGEDGVMTDTIPFTPKFSMSAGFKWTIIKNLRLTADYQHINGLYSGELIRMGAGDGSDFPEPIESNKLDDINLVNARISYRLSYKKLHIDQCEIFISASNLLNQTYEYYPNYPMPGITVMAGVDLKFK